ncbi:hypothetical protein LCGC14_2996380, partial [marine sediment metagenome]
LYREVRIRRESIDKEGGKEWQNLKQLFLIRME